MAFQNKLLVQLERYLRLEATDKLTVFITYLILAGVVFALGTSAVFFLCSACVEALCLVIGNRAIACLIIGVVLLLIIATFVLCKTLIQNIIVSNISESLLTGSIIPTSDDDPKDKDDDEDEEGGTE